MSDLISYLESPPLIPDEEDHRDWVSTGVMTKVIQRNCSIRAYAMPALTQRYGACASYAAMQMAYMVTRQIPSMRGIKISPMDLYWRTREAMGTIPDDSGSQLRATMRALTKPGVLPLFAFADPPSYTTRPPTVETPRFRIPGYERIIVGPSAPGAIMHQIYLNLCPVLIGLQIPERHIHGSFGQAGLLLDPPDLIEGEPVYRHCLLVDGWRTNGLFEVLNSWGPEWGNAGGGTIHQEWLANPATCMDIWTMSLDPISDE